MQIVCASESEKICKYNAYYMLKNLTIKKYETVENGLENGINSNFY